MEKIAVTAACCAGREELLDYDALSRDAVKGPLAGKNLPESTRAILLAAKKAMDYSGFTIKQADKNRTGIVGQCVFGSLESYEKFYDSVVSKHPEPAAFSCSLPYIPAANLSLCWGIAGPAITMVKETFGHYEALEAGLRLIEADMCDAVFVSCWHTATVTSSAWYGLKGVVEPETRCVVILLEAQASWKKRMDNPVMEIEAGADAGSIKNMMDDILQAAGKKGGTE